MNYELIYHRLCSRGQQSRTLEYKETHHILPRCMGGGDEKENLTDLTPEEHFVAHQILLKLYPGVRGLASAVQMMTIGMSNHSRSNRSYGWLKKRWISECRSRPAEKNPSFGTMWISNIEQKVSKKIKKNDLIPEGWVSGRNQWKSIRKCEVCGIESTSRNSRFCGEHRSSTSRNISMPEDVRERISTGLKSRNQKFVHPLKGVRKTQQHKEKISKSIKALVAQRIESLASNQVVGSSNLSEGANFGE